MWDDESKEVTTEYDVLVFCSAGNNPSFEDYRDYAYIIVVGGTQHSCSTSFMNIDIASPQVLGTATAGSNGAAILEVSVPGGWSEQTVNLQCAELNACRKSNVVTYSFP